MLRIYDEGRIHRSWSGLFSPDILRSLDAIVGEIGTQFAPARERVLRFAETDLDSARVIILGPEPYAKPGLSTGRPFEVDGLESWSAKNINAPLRNIVRNLYRTGTGNTEKFDVVRREIKNGRFSIIPPDRLFDLWESQGVILAYACPTCELDSPGSHTGIWSTFSASLVRFVTARRPDIAWFLWGKDVEALWERAVTRFAVKRDEYVTFRSPHPSSVGRSDGGSFVDCDCFETAAREFGIDWTGA